MNQLPQQADTSIAPHAAPAHAELPVIVAAAQPVSAQAADRAPIASKPVTTAKPPTAAAAIQMEQEAASKQAKQATDKVSRKKRLGELEGDQSAESSVDTSYEVAAADTTEAATPPAEATTAAGTSTAAASGGMPWLPVAGGGLGLAAIGAGGGGTAAAAPSTFAVAIGAVAGPVTAPLTYKIYDAQGNLVASGVTDATGKVTVNLANTYAGQALLITIADANGIAADFRDEASNGAASLGSTVLRAAFVATGGSQSVSVTPVTELAVQKMGITTNAATASATTVAATNAAVGADVGVSDILGAVTTVLSADYNEANGLSAAEVYARVLAKLSGLDQANGSMSATFTALLNALNISNPTLKASTLLTLLNEGAAKFEAGPNANNAALALTPTLTITDSVTSAPGIAAGPVTYTFMFSEAVSGFDAADITVTNGTKGTFTAVSATQYDLVVTPTSNAAGADIGVSVNSGTGGITYQSTLTTTIVKSAAAQAYDTAVPTATIDTAVFSADTGTAGDFTTATAAQTITGTLSANMVAGEIVEVSLDNGVTWATATTTVGSNTWSRAATLTASNTLQVRVSDLAGNHGTAFSQAYVLDTTVPTVASVALTSATLIQNSTLNAGDTVTATVTFSEAVTVTGTPQLALDIGGTTVQANYVGGTGSTALTFSYTILAGQTDANGIAVAANSLALNGGTIKDVAGNNATLTHALVADNASYMVDTTAPAAPSAPDMATGDDSGSSSSDGNTSNTTPTFTGTAEAGSTVTLYDTGGSTVLGTGVATGGTYSITSSTLSETGHTITAKATDAAGNVSVASGGLSVTIDATAPAAASINAVATDDIVNASEQTATITGTNEAGATVALSLDGNMRAATVTGATWSYTLTAADITAMGQGVKTLSVTQTDAAGNVSTAATRDITVETTVPTVSSVALASATGAQNNTLSVGDTVTATVNFSEAVTVNGTPQLALDIGGTTVQANYAAGSGTAALTFTYTILAAQTDANGIAIAANSLALNSGTISDAAGNNATLTHALVADNASFMVDTAVPTVASVALTSATGALNNTLNAGDTVTATVTFNEAVTVTGTPQLALNIGGTTVQANYAAGSGTTALTFTYTILAAQTDANGISVAADSLALNSGTISDAAGNSATLTHALVADNAGFMVDTTAPALPVINVVAGNDSATVQDDDQSSIWAVSGTTVNEGAGAFVYTVSRGGATDAAASIQFAIVGGAAIAGSDFVAQGPVTLSFAAGETSKTVRVALTDDALAELNETVVAAIGNASTGNIVTASATSTITEDDQSVASMSFTLLWFSRHRHCRRRELTFACCVSGG